MFPRMDSRERWWPAAIALFFLSLTSMFAQTEKSEDDYYLSPVAENDSDWKVNSAIGMNTIGAGSDSLRKNADAFGKGSKQRSVWSNRTQIASLEAFAEIRSDYSGEHTQVKADLDAFIPADGTGFEDERQSFFDVHDMYIKTGKQLTTKIGVLRHNWGTADFFRVVNFPDRVDRREFFIPVSETFYRGVPAFSLNYIKGDAIVELSIFPYHTIDAAPNRMSWWDQEPPREDMLYFTGTPALSGIPVPQIIAVRSKIAAELCSLPLNLRPENPIRQGSFTGYSCDREPVVIDDRRSKRSALAIRTGGKIGALDWHIAYYGGPSRSFYRILKILPSDIPEREPVILLQNKIGYEHKFGADFAAAWKYGTIRGELATQNRGGTTFSKQGSLEEGEGRLVSFTAGADLLLFKNEHRLVIEYMDSFFTERKFLPEPMSDLLSVGYEFSLYDGRITPSLIMVTRPVKSAPAFVQQAQIRYSILESMELTTGFIHIRGEDDDLLRLYHGRDVLFCRLKYRY